MASNIKITFDNSPHTQQLILESTGINQQLLDQVIRQKAFVSDSNSFLVRVARFNGDNHISECEAEATNQLTHQNQDYWLKVMQNPPCGNPQIAHRLFTNAIGLKKPELTKGFVGYLPVEDEECYRDIKASLGKNRHAFLSGLHFYIQTWAEEFPRTDWKKVGHSLAVFYSTEQKDGQTFLAMGSGIFIAPKVVLTARHVLARTDEVGNLIFDKNGEVVFREPMHLLLPQENQTTPIEVKSEQILINKMAGSEHDIALVYLDKGVPEHPQLPFAAKTPKLNSPVILAGWPGSSKRVSRGSAGETNYEFKQFSMLASRVESENPKLLNVDKMTALGYSGGACLNARGELAGVLSTIMGDKSLTSCVDVQGGQVIYERLLFPSIKDQIRTLPLWLGLAGLSQAPTGAYVSALLTSLL